jgi:DNA-3-methyladenine glycosylase I
MRCPWANPKNELYLRYHDEEWGVPVHDDAKHFEMLILEGAQAGLSWETILNKREGYRKAFAKFDPAKVARFTDARLAKLLENPGIVRNKLKVAAARGNAKAFLEIQEEFDSFDDFVWGFVDGETVQNRFKKMGECPASTPQSDALAKELKRRGFKFVGSTVCYAYMQAAGLVNDHLTSCPRYAELA